MTQPSASDRAIVPGSERPDLGAAPAPPAHALSKRAEVTVFLRARSANAPLVAKIASELPGAREYVSREAFAEKYGATSADIAAVETFALGAGLEVVMTDAARRSVVLAGTVAGLAVAFGADLRSCVEGGETYRSRSGSLSVPVALAKIVVGVFGFDQRPQARAHFRRLAEPAASKAVSYTPLQIAGAYDFPTGVDGTGETIALIELGGGFVQSDLDTYFSGLGLRSPKVTAVAIDGGANAPAGNPDSADGEVMLDIEVAGAIAPGAAIAVYFAPNTDRGFLDAITTAIHDTDNKPSIISISWGGPEASWTQQALTSFDAAFADAATLGISVFAAAGDNGSTDGATDGVAHVDFPASSPHVTACGGTSLTLSNERIGRETVWNDGTSGGATGGGISDVFALPAYQSKAGVPASVNAGMRGGRGVPDVAGDADPQTGYKTRVDGSDGVVGGTSAVAPLWAGLIALGNQRFGKPLGFLNTALYAAAAAGTFHDITSGSNGAYSAGPGWDACTGLGTPDGAKLIAALTAAATVPANHRH